MQYWSLTDPGCVRAQNQDACRLEVLDKNTLLCVVCDGMGGAKSGNIASQLAADVFTQEIKRSWKPDMDPDRLDQMLYSAVKLANFTVYDQALYTKDLSSIYYFIGRNANQYFSYRTHLNTTVIQPYAFQMEDAPLSYQYVNYLPMSL